jgi:kynureninase
MSDRHLHSEEFARELDAQDELAEFRAHFHLPRARSGEAAVYLCGHSLGLQPQHADTYVRQELWDWAHLGVEGHFRGRNPWYSYHEWFAEPLARLTGAEPHEVVAMNSLTVNLHLMLTSFYQPTADRPAILTDAPAFPSDRYAFESVVRNHHYDPLRDLYVAEDPEAVLAEHGHRIQVVVLNVVNFLTGARMDVPKFVRLAHQHGCVFGLDLAHAVGNVPLHLHDWGVDFAVWCSYKYLNAGPGAVGGCFIHEKHGKNEQLPRLAGWWGNDPATRFRMQLQPHFIPKPGADGWQISNPPILSLAPLRASLELFDKATMARLRAKSERITQYLEMLLDRIPRDKLTQVTPREPERRGGMLALQIHQRAKHLVEQLEAQGIVCDFREPDIIRVTPAPLYNSFHDVWRFANVLQTTLA